MKMQGINAYITTNVTSAPNQKPFGPSDLRAAISTLTKNTGSALALLEKALLYGTHEEQEDAAKKIKAFNAYLTRLKKRHGP